MDSMSCGAKGIASFEQNLDFGYLPDESSIEHEGIFYDYYFKTPQTDKHFDVSFSFGITPDPLSQTPEYYLGLGIGSRLDGAGLYKYGGRPNLNLVICLDISGSMSSSFTYEETESKLSVAKSSLLVLLSKLRPDDHFGLVVFDTEADVVQPLRPWKSTDVKTLKEKILSIETRGGTDLSIGLHTSASLFTNVTKTTNSNRIVFMTDMLVNAGTADGEGLYNLTKEFVQKKIFMTFIGVGADFNTELVSKLTLLRGTNYLSVSNTKEFKRHMEDEFDYLVTPSVYDVSISFTSNAWSVDRVYGSPGFEYPAQGKLVQIDSTFPSPEDKEHAGMTKGGIVIIKLHKLADSSDPIVFTLTYEDNTGEKHRQEYSVVLPKWSGGEKYEDTSLQKGVLLVRYVNFMKHYLRNAGKVPNISTSSGITIPPLLQKENRHKSLTKVANLTEEWAVLFNLMIKYFSAQIDIIQDKTLEKEFKRLEDFTVPRHH